MRSLISRRNVEEVVIILSIKLKALEMTEKVIKWPVLVLFKQAGTFERKLTQPVPQNGLFRHQSLETDVIHVSQKLLVSTFEHHNRT